MAMHFIATDYSHEDMENITAAHWNHRAGEGKEEDMTYMTHAGESFLTADSLEHIKKKLEDEDASEDRYDDSMLGVFLMFADYYNGHRRSVDGEECAVIGRDEWYEFRDSIIEEASDALRGAVGKALAEAGYRFEGDGFDEDGEVADREILEQLLAN